MTFTADGKLIGLITDFRITLGRARYKPKARKMHIRRKALQREARVR